MSLKKIADPPFPPCSSPQHRPPMHMVYEPGTYEWTCPLCWHKTVFTVPRISFQSSLQTVNFPSVEPTRTMIEDSKGWAAAIENWADEVIKAVGWDVDAGFMKNKEDSKC